MKYTCPLSLIINVILHMSMTFIARRFQLAVHENVAVCQRAARQITHQGLCYGAKARQTRLLRGSETFTFLLKGGVLSMHAKF